MPAAQMERADRANDLDKLFEVAPALLWVAGTDGFFKRVNPEFSSLLGYSEAELLATPIQQLIHPADRARTLTESVDHVVRTAEFTFENRWICKDGTVRWLSWRSRFIPEFGLTYAAALDISAGEARKFELREAHEAAQNAVHARAELEVAHAAAATANEAKTEFLSRMSHELRTPLNVIIGFGQLLTMGELDEDEESSVGYILKASRQLLGLIDEVLDITRVESGALAMSIETVRIAEVATDVIAMMGPLALENAVSLRSELDDRSYVLADRGRLRQVLINLVANAIKYGNSGGTVTIRCEPCSESMTRLAVIDRGPGIAAIDLDRVFHPFERLGAAAADVQGTGLGLPIAQRLIEAMAGTIGVTSELGQGATFWVNLPTSESLTLAQVVVPRSNKSDAPALPEGEHIVLSIEDNLANARLINRVLAKRPGIRLLQAMQGQVGLDLARAHKPDLIFLDLHLPDMSGESVLRALQADPETAGIRVVIASADATLGQVGRLKALGAYDYLPKPIDVFEFLALVDKVFATAEPA